MSDATEWHEYEALKYEIGALRAHPEIQGYVITEFTDVNWEANGLLDMWRHPKAFGEALGRLQQDDLLILRSDKRNYKAGETVEADVYISHYGPGTWRAPEWTGKWKGPRWPAACPWPRWPLPARPRWGQFASLPPPAQRPLNGS